MVSTCRLLGVSRQVYYRRKLSENTNRQIATAVVMMVAKVRMYMPKIGTLKLYHILHDQLKELHVGRDKLFDIIKANHLEVKSIRSYKTTPNSHHRFRKHKNLIVGVKATSPEQIWVSDITYIGSRGHHSYLSLITDAYSRKIVGYNLSDNLGAEGVIKALKMAIRGRICEKLELIHHYDRGIQYCCDAYQQMLKKHNLTVSMTESYAPYANAIAERVNGIIKNEFELEKYAQNRNVLERLVKSSIKTYNEMRPHLSCNMQTPKSMHQIIGEIKVRDKKEIAHKLELIGY
ncbi:IS3 family transposase [Prolixibacteraceae bacterium]|nr:IS3 family transposase [Prolixibacteraceae bacterium]